MRLLGILIPLAAALGSAAPNAAPPRGMFDLYAANRAQGKPNFITEDFVLLGYAMSLDRAMGQAEEQVYLPESVRIVDGLARNLRASLAEDDDRRAAVTKSALMYLAVVRALLAGEEPAGPPPVVEEVQRVRAAAGIARSELVLQSLDYSQFRPRGRYTRTPALQHYFQGARYAGTVLFAVTATQATGLTDEQADRLTAEALILARALRHDRGLAPLYNRLNQRLATLFGPAEDLTAGDLASLVEALPVREARARLLERARRTGRQPQILAAPVEVGRLEKGTTAADALTGWRLFPLRYTSDSAAMQQLVYDRVKRYKGSGHPESLAVIGGQPVKAFPLAREVMAALGSGDAARDLDAADERNYEGYGDGFRRAVRLLSTGHDLTSRQLQILGEWMRTAGPEDSRRRLDAALAFWTWTRYNNVLYAKQSYTAVQKGISLMQPRGQAWIEPSATLYQKLAVQLDLLRPTLPSLGGMARLLHRCAELSKIENLHAALDPEQLDFLNGLDLEFLKFTGHPDRPIIVDVHTEPNTGLVLEEAVGFPAVATHALAGGAAAVGVRFTHREFKQSMSRRLNDDEWLNILEKEEMTKGLTVHPAATSRSAPRLILAMAQTAQGRPDDFLSLINRGGELASQKRWEEALRLFERAHSRAQDKRQAAQADARTGQTLGELGREREGIEYLQRSLELYHYDQVEEELRQMRIRLLSRTQTVAEISDALKDQEASHRGTRVLPARPLMLRVLFDFDKDTLTPEGLEQVGNLGDALAKLESGSEIVEITGHTDLIGTEEYNQDLSERRAERVADEIVRRHGFPTTRLRTVGKGMREPLYHTTSPEDSALNRRVEVMIGPR